MSLCGSLVTVYYPEPPLDLFFCQNSLMSFHIICRLRKQRCQGILEGSLLQTVVDSGSKLSEKAVDAKTVNSLKALYDRVPGRWDTTGNYTYAHEVIDLN